ncbi:MAG: succinylglutamate desuccinylase/aspartoacylase family protein [Bacteroidales bacterium]|nr:succinylglutamate desuccinylase/aspartoacylase family protein [Bacteroidales bacterium]
MIINNTEIQAGESGSIEVNIARLPSRTAIDIMVTVARAAEPGPVLLLLGGLHGDEINGIEIVRRIVERDHHIPVKGTVICIPILNIYGFINFSRNVPDGKDVNRSFPGNNSGSLASRIAYYLMKDIVPKIDCGVDFHTGGADRANHPQVRCMLNDPLNMELANAFYAPVTLHAKYRPGSLSQAAAKLGKQIIVFEGGESSRLNEGVIEQGISGTLRLMNYLGLSSHTLVPPEYENRVFMHSSWIRERTSGIFQSLVQCGDDIKKNQTVGFITDPFGEYRVRLKSHTSGQVISLNNDPVLHQGDAVMQVGVS